MRNLDAETFEEHRAYTVSEFTREIKDLLSIEYADLTVLGEISGYKVSHAGHVYFSLKDENAVLNAVIWRSVAARLRTEMRDGLEVQARGRIDVYPPRGSYQLIVQSIHPVGEGDLQKRFEELKRKLLAEGLFDEERKRPLPTSPERIAVVTSPTGAAIRDFLKILVSGYPGLAVEVFPVHVQGKEAPGEIAHALEVLNRLCRHDLIVVTRGGGSLEDLWSFNEEIVARAIAASGIPVLSAVGHEVDFTISDFVADVRAPTPTGAALLLVEQREAFLNELKSLNLRLARSVSQLLSESRMRLEATQKAVVRASPIRQVEMYRQRIDDLLSLLSSHAQSGIERAHLNVRHERERLVTLCRKRIDERRSALEVLRGRLDSLGPLATLRRGYAHVTRFPEQETVSSTRQVRAGDRLSIRVADGRFQAEVT